MVVWLSWRSDCCGVGAAPGATAGLAGVRSTCWSASVAAAAVEGLVAGPTASARRGWGRAGRRAGGAGASAGTAAVEGLSVIAGDYLYGSAASRKPSPRKLKARTTMITGTTGIISQG